MANDFIRDLRRKKIDLNDYALCFDCIHSYTKMTREIKLIKNTKKSVTTFHGISRPIFFIYFDKKENVEKGVTSSYTVKGLPLKVYYDKSDKNQSNNSLKEDNDKSINFLFKTIKSLNLDFLAKMFSRYYIDGYCKFCVYISPKNHENLPLHNFFFPPVLYEKLEFFSFKKEDAKNAVMAYYKDMIEKIDSSSHNKHLGKKIFLNYIDSLFEIINQYDLKNDLTHENCNLLDEMLKDLTIKTDILSDYLKKTITGLIDELIGKKILSRCQHCKSTMKYRLYKKYCTTAYENRDCGKKARDKKYYQKYKDEIKIKAKKTAKERREFYKQHGMKIH